jgi:Helix-loop-helix DNA-binding domain
MQYEQQSSPGTVLHSDQTIGPGRRPSFIANYPDLRPPSCHIASNALSCQHHNPLNTTFPGPETLTVPTKQNPGALLPGLVSPSPKHEPSSTSVAKEVAENADSATSRSGKRWKAAHRAVERRYRSNLNLKIAKLGQCIPAMRNQETATEHSVNGKDSRAAPKAKLQKGHVLSKALDYIQSLKQHVSELEAEKNQLQSRVQALNVLVEEEIKYHQENPACGKAPGVPRRFSEPQSRRESRAKKGSSSTMEDETLEALESESESDSSFEARNRSSHAHNEICAVSEDPSPASKRPRPTRTKGGIARISAG